LIVASLMPDAASAEIVIRLVTTGQPHIEVTGLPAPILETLKEQPPDHSAWQRILALYVASDTARTVPLVIGDHTVSPDGLIFTPRFPLKPALRYRAVFDTAGLPGEPSSALRRTEAIVSLPALPAAPPTIVETVFPSVGVLPENQLKFYIHFSAPMRRGDSYRHIQLLTAEGSPVEAPFLELAEELWDESGQRLTLLLDPGRVKQDLKPHKEVGRAIAEGHNYTLLIKSDWRDARGAPLAGEFRKTFRVIDADVRQPDPRRWKVKPPRPGTREPLVIDFDEPLDHALLQHMILVLNPANKHLDGRVTIDENETRWSFKPKSSWSVGAHRLLVGGALEDLAGNSITRPFEVYLPAGRPAETDHYVLPFQIERAISAADPAESIPGSRSAQSQKCLAPTP
jgi:hypothetical protein